MLFALLQDAATTPQPPSNAVMWVRIAAGVGCVLIIVVIVLRRKSKKKKAQVDDEF